MKKLIRGFTIIELALTITLVGIMAITAGVIAIHYTDAFVDIAAEKARSDIEHARSLAMTKKGTVYGVYFNQAANQYTVYEGSVATPVEDPQTKQSLVENFSKWSGVTITGGNYTVEFNQFGAPTAGGGGSVSITDGTKTKIITVAADTGKVTIN